MVSQLLDQLKSLEERNQRAGKETFVALNPTDEGALEMKLNGPAAVHLCRLLLDLVHSDIDGKHQHLDQISFVDEGNGRLILTYSS